MFKGLGQIGDMAKVMKQAQEMQGKMEEAQERLNTIEVEGQAGGGLVTARATAKGELIGITISDDLFKPEEREVVEDLILAAIKDAQSRASDASQAEMAKVTEGLQLPPGMKLPF